MRECVAAGVRLRGNVVVAVQCSAGAVNVEATLRKSCWRGRLVLTSWRAWCWCCNAGDMLGAATRVQMRGAATAAGAHTCNNYQCAVAARIEALQYEALQRLRRFEAQRQPAEA